MLLLEGNPLRGIRRDLLTVGDTTALDILQSYCSQPQNTKTQHNWQIITTTRADNTTASSTRKGRRCLRCHVLDKTTTYPECPLFNLWIVCCFVPKHLQQLCLVICCWQFALQGQSPFQILCWTSVVFSWVGMWNIVLTDAHFRPNRAAACLGSVHRLTVGLKTFHHSSEKFPQLPVSQFRTEDVSWISGETSLVQLPTK